ncbi:hypothetical protein Y032_0400g770 [Ancylostoma ceylanicum]|uniref:Uncharacterized protein n=1 Tax=Ancylostoma ceylanicum TaxID=53326 RepID=A0A016RQW3_9BILA|nr:hypothetical protein Y032_0400g770 [Ancylostoma ceylanicum]
MESYPTDLQSAGAESWTIWSSDDVTLELTSFGSFSHSGPQVRPCFELNLVLLDVLAQAKRERLHWGSQDAQPFQVSEPDIRSPVAHIAGFKLCIFISGKNGNMIRGFLSELMRMIF